MVNSIARKSVINISKGFKLKCFGNAAYQMSGRTDAFVQPWTAQNIYRPAHGTTRHAGGPFHPLENILDAI